MSNLAEYLASLGCELVTDGKLTIGKHTFRAVHYKQHGRDFICVVGDRPPVLKRKRKMALRINDDSRDWYVATYYSDKPVTDDQWKYHPFGQNFLLALWDLPEPIDKYNYWRGEHKPYLRISAKLEAA